MSDTESDIPNLIDRSVKRLFRDQPQAVLCLAGVQQAIVRFEDSNLNITATSTSRNCAPTMYSLSRKTTLQSPMRSFWSISSDQKPNYW